MSSNSRYHIWGVISYMYIYTAIGIPIAINHCIFTQCDLTNKKSVYYLNIISFAYVQHYAFNLNIFLFIYSI